MKFLLHHNIIKLRPVLYFIALTSFINYFSSNFFFRFDLTEDKRNSLNQVTKNFLTTIKQPIDIKIYLHGDLPVLYKRLRNSIESNLIEFKITNQKINYEFIDVDSFDEANLKFFFDELKKNKLYAHNIFIRDRGKKLERYIYPFIKIKALDREKFFNIFCQKNNFNKNFLFSAQENFEYNLVSALHELLNIKDKLVGILTNIGEPPKHNFKTLTEILKKNYKYKYLTIDNLNNIKSLDALIITHPSKPFSEKQKFILDQYLMQGKNIILFMNNIKFTSNSPLILAYPTNLNLTDLLYSYGLRINNDIIKDSNCSYNPIIIGGRTKKSKIDWFKWPFKPLIFKKSKHIITKNIGQILGENMSSIDILKKKDITHIPLLYSSKKSYAEKLPFTINLKEITTQNNNQLNQGPYLVSVLVEGKFQSHYKNKFIPIDDFDNKHFIKKSKHQSKIFLVSSGLFPLNKVDHQKHIYYPMGYDDYFNHQFSQNILIENILSYMLDDFKLIYAKKKNLKIRLINEPLTRNYFLTIQFVNIVIPILLLVIFGLFWDWFYKKRYSKFTLN